jgi:ABC-2 type transport system ATP-binding protein
LYQYLRKINVINKIVYASDELGYINRKLESIAKDYILMYKNFDLEFAEKLLELFELNKKVTYSVQR